MTFDVSSGDRNSNGDDTSIRVDGSMGGTTALNHTNDIGAGIHNNDDDDDDDDIISIMKNNSNSNSNSNNNNRNDDDGTNDDDDNDDATIAARSLIARLQGDFRAEGKRTCRDCLRSKTLPCSRVTEVANELVAADAGTGGSTLPLPLVLERAHSILLREHATVLPPNSGSGSDPPSALVCMNRIAAVLRFVQLLLWLSSRKGDDDDDDDHHRSKNPTRALLLPAAETNAAMASLLQALTHGICDLLGSSNSSSSSTPTPNVIVDVDVDADDHGPDCPSDPLLADATKSLLPGPVFCYAFFSLLRMNEYVRTRGALVVPLWKGLCDLAETLVAAAVVPEGASDHPDENENENENNDDDNDEDNDDREDETHDWRNHLPPNLLGDAIRILGEFLREGKERLEVGAVTNCWNGCASEGKDGIHTHNTIVFQGRFVGFLVARMTHLLGVYFSLRGGGSGSSGSSDDDATTTHDDDDDDDEGEPRDPPVTNEVWRSLLGLRGMATALQVLHSSSEANTAVVVGVGVGGIDRSFLKVYCEIAAKAGKCITGMVVPPSPRPKSNSYSDPRTRQIRTRTRTRALESLLQSTMARKGNDDDDDDDDDDTGDDSFHYRDRKDAHVRSKAIRLSDLGNTTGKVLVLQQVLQRMATAETAAGGFFSAESLLVTIEAIHSVAVPDCLAACIVAVRGERGVDPSAAVDADPSNIATTAITTTLPTTIVDGSLRIMVRALKAVATSDEFASRTVEVESEAESKRDALHRLLVRWLAGSSGGGGTNPGDGATHPYPYPHHHQHPLAREMVVSLLHAHILGSATATTTGREIGHSTKKLLSLLTKLCVDARTHWLLRSNIGALLIRLQQSKSPGTTGASVSASASSVAVSELARQIVEKEFVARLSRDATQSRECKQRKRKRKRTRSRKDDTTVEQLDPEDVRVVSRVLGSGRALSESLGSSLNNHNHNHNDDDNNDQHRILRGEFSWLSSGLGVSGGLADSEEALLAVAGRISLLLAWLERIIATTTTGSGSPLQRFRGTTGLDLVVDIVKPAVAAIASLTFRPGGVDSAKVLRRKVLLYCAALRLCATAATVFGNNDDGNELPLERVGLLIKHALSKEALQNERGNGGNGSTIDIDPLLVRGQQSILKFEVLNLLGCIGNAIPSACSERVLRVSVLLPGLLHPIVSHSCPIDSVLLLFLCLCIGEQTIRRAFASCLSSGDWAVASVGISSLVSFGSQLHPAHQRILPQCLARASTGFFQARASDRLWKGKHCDSSTAKEESVWELVDGMAHRLYPCSHGCGHEHQRRLTVRSVLPSATTTSTIAPGSYIMEMPTQGDRSAMVVFPPGPQSLEDIRYMLGMDVGDENDNDNDGNDENATVPAQRLKRAIATSRGGLKLLLLPLRKPS
eukprot:jgi/Psemu1/67987/estExt_Genemark1.C_4070004